MLLSCLQWNQGLFIKHPLEWGPDFEAKISKLMVLGFGREGVIQALTLADGNEEQAAGYLFGG
ncbi:hypothetical protein AMTRI_Chr10g233060 [Amborella trichopoda]